MEPEEKEGKQDKEQEKPSGPSTPVPLVRPPQPISHEPVKPAGENLIEVTDLTWEKTVEKATDPVTVMFYSPTCTFCHQMEPYFRAFAKEFSGTIIFARINIIANHWTAERYGVRSTPTFKLFCNGKPVTEMIGAVYPAILKKTVEEVLVRGKECGKKVTEIDYEITGYG
ncbi:MAG: thioredoxin 2 [Methanoregula sp. PtaU1.Bin051]|nr:MAG: thioredoxin 2 [Methanoregula sp. PtaU1.Bin051]